VSFQDQIRARSADVYADFLAPHLSEETRLLDCGTGSGTIAIGLCSHVPRGSVVGIDRSAESPREALAHCRHAGLRNLAFLACDARCMPFDDHSFDVVFSHSMLETFEQPLLALAEMRRVLRPGGTIGLASVEYSGVICSGPNQDLLRLFYACKERVWELDGLADPRMGQNLRQLLHAAGFEAVQASAKYICHGTAAEVSAFGRARANDCEAPWFAATALRHDLLSQARLDEIRAAWLEWAESPDAFAAFSWCRAVALSPSPETS